MQVEVALFFGMPVTAPRPRRDVADMLQLG
jgi:hypothetical protein